jgi:hypothetical protein
VEYAYSKKPVLLSCSGSEVQVTMYIGNFFFKRVVFNLHSCPRCVVELVRISVRFPRFIGLENNSQLFVRWLWLRHQLNVSDVVCWAHWMKLISVPRHFLTDTRRKLSRNVYQLYIVGFFPEVHCKRSGKHFLGSVTHGMKRNVRDGTMWRWVVSFSLWPPYFRGRSQNTNVIGRWVAPSIGLDVIMRKFLPSRKSNPTLLVCSPVTLMSEWPAAGSRFTPPDYEHKSLVTWSVLCVLDLFGYSCFGIIPWY